MRVVAAAARRCGAAADASARQVLEQEQRIDYNHDAAVGARAHMEKVWCASTRSVRSGPWHARLCALTHAGAGAQANKNLVDAMQSSFSFRVFVLVFLIAASLLLLLYDWYS